MGIKGIKAIYPHKKKSISIKDGQRKIYGYLLEPYWNKSEKSGTVNLPYVNEV